MVRFASLLVLLLGAYGLIDGPTARGESRNSNAPLITNYNPASLVLQLNAEDLGRAATILQGMAFEIPQEGSKESMMLSETLVTHIEGTGIKYSMLLRDLALAPQANGLKAKFTVQKLKMSIDTIYFDVFHLTSCDGIRVNSLNASIPMEMDITPFVDKNGKLAIRAANANVALSARNFMMSEPDACHVMFGFNWLVERVLPVLVNNLTGLVASSIEEKVPELAAEVGAQMGSALAINWPFPFAVDPIPAFDANATFTPSKISIDRSGIQFLIGSKTEIVRPAMFLGREVAAGSGVLNNNGKSFFGITSTFINSILDAAVVADVLTFTVDPNKVPSALAFTSANLRRILPDAAKKFVGDEAVTLAFSGAKGMKATNVRMVGDQAMMDLEVNDLKVKVAVNGNAYATFEFNGIVPLHYFFDDASASVVMNFGNLSDLSATVVGDASETPTALEVDQAALHDVLTDIDQALAAAKKTELFTFALPPFNVGKKNLHYGPLHLVGSYIVLDTEYR